MAGIEISKAFWEEYGKPMIEKDFKEYADRIAVGLVGHGSECFGFDDGISRDHDFDAGFSIWLTDEDEKLFGFKLFRAYSKLPKEFRGIKLQKKSLLGSDEKGVKTIGEFYAKYTGRSGAPETWQDWFYTPSEYFAEATNGEVFSDPLGEFTKIRRTILCGMPDDVRLKKIASKLITMAQSGQYNFARCLSHGEKAAAQLYLAQFAELASELIYLLNHAHAPYKKWLFRGMKSLVIFGEKRDLLTCLLTDTEADEEKKQALIEEICGDIVKYLTAEFCLSQNLGDYLEPYAYAINDKIKNHEIRSLHIMQD